MKKAIIIISGLGLLGYGFYKYISNQKKLLSEFDWKISGFKIIRFSLTELLVDVEFLFTSKSNVEAEVNKLYLDLFLNGQNVGYVEENKSFIIPAKGSSKIPIRLSVNPQLIAKNLVDVILGSLSKKDVIFSLKGYVGIKSGFVKTTLPLEYQKSIKDQFSKNK